VSLVCHWCVWLPQGLSEEDIVAELAPAPDDPQPLSVEEEAERATLLREGFSNWNRRDFQAFVRAAERFGRSEVDKIAGELEGKSREEVAEYSKVGWCWGAGEGGGVAAGVMGGDGWLL
jgi:SWI/SNF-related matrix-associated actin-dependent regulator of chromatin subfamily A member 5